MLTTSSSFRGVQLCRFGSEDAGICIAALKLLQSSSYSPLRMLHCDVTDAVVIVHGVLPSFFLKQKTQSLIQHLEGINGVMNLVEVREIDSCSCQENEDATPEVDPSHSRFHDCDKLSLVADTEAAAKLG